MRIADRARCDVLVDGKKVGEQTGARRSPEQEIRFFDVEYPIPADLVADKRKSPCDSKPPTADRRRRYLASGSSVRAWNAS